MAVWEIHQPYLRLGTNDVHEVVGSGATFADAQTEARAVAALTVGTKLGAGTSTAPVTDLTPFVMHAASAWEQAKIGIVRIVGGAVVDRTILELHALSTAYNDGQPNGINTTNADIIDLVSTYRDTDGNGGWSIEYAAFQKL